MELYVTFIEAVNRIAQVQLKWRNADLNVFLYWPDFFCPTTLKWSPRSMINTSTTSFSYIKCIWLYIRCISLFITCIMTGGEKVNWVYIRCILGVYNVYMAVYKFFMAVCKVYMDVYNVYIRCIRVYIR